MSEIFTRDAFAKPLEVMKPIQACCLQDNASVADALGLILEKKIGSILVIDQNRKLSGIFTDRDLMLRVGNTSEALEKLPLKNVMTNSPLILSLKTPISKAFEIVVKKHIRHMPVFLDESQSVESLAMISARDILRFIVECFPESVASHGTTTADEVLINDAHDDSFLEELQQAGSQYLTGNVFSLPLAKVISSPPLFVPPSTSLDVVYERLVKEKTETVLVVEYDTQLIGILTERDFVTRVIGKKLWGQRVPISQVMSQKPKTLMPRHKIAHGINNMFKYGHRHIVLVDEEKYPVGSVSVLEILHFLYHRIYTKSEV
ncbi:MAG: CBS domain-containing protein [Bdellovibrio sp.]|nr:CBS domain-containing protein [Bdellovibrio sp.]